MEFLSLGFPYSIFGLGAGIFLGGCVMSIVFGLLTTLIIFLAIWFNIIRIDPILSWIQTAARWFFPSVLERYKENIRRSFTIEVDPSLLAARKAGSGEPCKSSIYVWHPHGLFSASVFFHILSPFTQFPEILRPLSQVVLSGVCSIPGLHQLVPLWDITPSHEKDMNVALEKKKSLSVVLGGVREILYTQPKRLTLNIAKKKGIFKLALQHGTDLIPVITYGENELYELTPAFGLKKINKILFDWTGLVLPFPTLKCIQKWYGLLENPLATPVHTVIGPALSVEKVDPKDICESMIEKLRNRYIDSLNRLYLTTKPEEYADEIEFV